MSPWRPVSWTTRYADAPVRTLSSSVSPLVHPSQTSPQSVATSNVGIMWTHLSHQPKCHYGQFFTSVPLDKNMLTCGLTQNNKTIVLPKVHRTTLCVLHELLIHFYFFFMLKITHHNPIEMFLDKIAQVEIPSQLFSNWQYEGCP